MCKYTGEFDWLDRYGIFKLSVAYKYNIYTYFIDGGNDDDGYFLIYTVSIVFCRGLRNDLPIQKLYIVGLCFKFSHC